MSNLIHRPGDPNGGRQPEGPGKKPLPPRYSDELAVAIIERIKAGAHPDRAAVAEGLSLPEYNSWKRDVELGYAHSRVVEFFGAIERAEAVFEADTIQELNKELSPADRLKLIEKRFPKNWSTQLKVTYDKELDAAVRRLEGLTRIERMMSGEEAFEEAIRLLCGG